jgi:Tol biopolymer transport system component
MNEREQANPFQADLEERLAQADARADPDFRWKLEKRLRERARAELPRRAAIHRHLSTAWQLGLGAAFVLVLALGLSLLFKSIRPWGIGSGSTPTPEPTRVPTVLAGQETAPTAIPLTPPTTVPFPTPSTMTLQVTQSGDGSWTTYTDPAWQQNGAVVQVSAITIGQGGAVWAGTMGGPVATGTGVYRFEGGSWTRFTDQDGIPFMEVEDMATAPDGKLWFATACCGVSSFDGKTWTTYTTASGLPSNDIRSLVFAPDGALWLGTEDKGVVRFDGKGWRNYTEERDGLWGNTVTHGFVMPDGSLLFSTSTTWPYLSRFDRQAWSQYAPEGGPAGFYTADITTAPDGALWFATSEGVFRFDGKTWTHFTTQDGLASNQVFRVVASPENVLWFGTDSGLSRFDGGQWTTFTTRNGLASDWVSALAMAPDGTLWAGTPGGITRYAPALSIAPSPTPAAPLSLQSSHNDIRALMFNPTWQTLWIQGEASTYSPAGVRENTYMQAWIGRDGTGRVMSTDPIPGSLNLSLDMDVRHAWVSDGQGIASLDLQSGQPADTPAGIMHPLDRVDPVLGIVFPSYLAVRSEDLQVVKMDEQAGRLALVATWASYRIWIDVQTGLILRSQTLDQNGAITSDIQVTAILMDPQIPATELSQEGLDQARFERAPAGAGAASSATGAGEPTTSANGSIVFSASTDNATELFIMDPDGANVTQLTHDNANNLSPACSKDGQWIAYTSFRNDLAAIYLVHPDGSGETRLADNPSRFVDLSFSPDGQKIAFVSERDGNPEIYVVGIDGSGLARLTHNSAVEDSPAWSPDGTQIAFMTNRDGPYQIYVMAADGSGQVNLSNSPSNDLQPAWSPDGSKIAFYSYERGADKAASEIYVMSRDGSNVTALTASPQGADKRQFFNPAWSPDGKRMVFFSNLVGSDGVERSRGMYVMPADGSGLIGLIVQLTPSTDYPALDATGRPCWLPGASASLPSTQLGGMAQTQSLALTQWEIILPLLLIPSVAAEVTKAVNRRLGK